MYFSEPAHLCEVFVGVLIHVFAFFAHNPGGSTIKDMREWSFRMAKEVTRSLEVRNCQGLWPLIICTSCIGAPHHVQQTPELNVVHRFQLVLHLIELELRHVLLLIIKGLTLRAPLELVLKLLHEIH